MQPKPATPIVIDSGARHPFASATRLGQQPGPVPLAEHLLARFREAHSVPKKGADALAQFVEFVGTYLAVNPPQTQTYTETGLVLRLTDGSSVTLYGPAASVRKPVGSVPIATPRSQPGQNGITESGAVPITGPESVQHVNRTEGVSPAADPPVAKGPNRNRKRG